MAELVLAETVITGATGVCFARVFYNDATNRLTRFEMQNTTGHPYRLVVQHLQFANRRYDELITPALVGRNLNINLDIAQDRWTAGVEGA
jgi:hypothetical protein